MAEEKNKRKSEKTREALLHILKDLSKKKKEAEKAKEAVLHMLTSVSKAGKELGNAKEYIDNIIKSMIDALIVVDPDGIIKTINKATTDLLGYTEDELIGKPVAIIFAEKTSFKKNRMKTLIKVGSIKDYDMRYKTKSGDEIPVGFSCSVMKDKKGNLIGIVCIARDMRETRRFMQKEKELVASEAAAYVEKKKKEELEKAYRKVEISNKDLERFAYIASHDLQEPLRKITSFGKLIKTQYENVIDKEGQNYLDRIGSAAKRMKQLIDNLLEYSRLTTCDKSFKRTNLMKVIREVIKDLELKISEEKAEIKISNLPIINANPLQMRQLFHNLIINALKFRKEDESPRVLINSRSINNRLVEITIEDNGIGFDKEYVKKIFKTFQGFYPRGKYEGTGIGLAICEKVAQLHNGKITARSKPGKGSTFIVTLPKK